MHTSRSIVLRAVTVALLLPFFLSAQTPTSQIPPQMAVITFVGEINTTSMGQLVTITNGQIRAGIHKIRIVISSNGGDASAAFFAYNYLRSLPSVEISTFNIGNVDSAAVILYCAGTSRYSFPATRFLLHGNSLIMSGNVTMDAAALQGNLELLKNLNQVIVRVVGETVNADKRVDVENAVRGQVILTSDDAVKWGLVQEVRSNFMEPGAVLVTVNTPSTPEVKPPIQFSSVTTSTKAASKTPKH